MTTNPHEPRARVKPVYLDLETHRLLKFVAYERGETMTSILRELVATNLKPQRPLPPEPQVSQPWMEAGRMKFPPDPLDESLID